jgi:hypothetical protein
MNLVVLRAGLQSWSSPSSEEQKGGGSGVWMEGGQHQDLKDRRQTQGIGAYMTSSGYFLPQSGSRASLLYCQRAMKFK